MSPRKPLRTRRGGGRVVTFRGRGFNVAPEAPTSTKALLKRHDKNLPLKAGTGPGRGRRKRPPPSPRHPAPTDTNGLPRRHDKIPTLESPTPAPTNVTICPQKTSL